MKNRGARKPLAASLAAGKPLDTGGQAWDSATTAP